MQRLCLLLPANCRFEHRWHYTIDIRTRDYTLNAPSTPQFGMDEIAIGDLEESEVQAARARRKAINTKLESSLSPAVRSVMSEVKSVLAAM